MTVIRIKKRYSPEWMTEEFLRRQENKHVSKETIDQHRYALNALHSGCIGVPTLEDVRRCLPPSMGNAYYNKRLNTYKQYFRLLIELRHCLTDPTKDIHYKRQTFRIGNYEKCSTQKFLKGFPTDTFAGLRNKTMALLIIDTGIRPSEVVKLRTDDLLASDRVIRLRAEITKTRRERLVPVSRYIVNKIRELKRYELPEWGNKFLFCTSDGKQLRTSVLRDACKLVAEKTGVSFTPYDFRHIFATTYIKNGGDSFSLQKILGHTTPQMTSVYVNLSAGDLSEKHDCANVLSTYISEDNKRVRNLK